MRWKAARSGPGSPPGAIRPPIMVGMLPGQMPVLTRSPVVLRAFRDEDVGLVQSVAADR